MNAEDLRARQAPFKEKYKADPAAAIVIMRAEAVLDSDGISCRMVGRKATDIAGLHPAAGGDGNELCSGDMLLEALVGCAGVTLKAVATALGIHMERARVLAEGDVDFRGTLGVDKTAPVGFTAIRLTFDIRSGAPREKIDQLVRLAERYCVVYQTLARSPALTISVAVLP